MAAQSREVVCSRALVWTRVCKRNKAHVNLRGFTQLSNPTTSRGSSSQSRIYSNRIVLRQCIGGSFGPFKASTFHSSATSLQKDFYELLGVSRDSSQDEIKRAYYQLAKKYHPDRNKDDKKAATKFKEIGEAYEVLGNEQKRRQYDQLGRTGFGAQGGAGGPFGSDSSYEYRSSSYEYRGNMNPDDLFNELFRGSGFNVFSDFFGGGFSSATSQVVLRLSFLEAVRGCDKQINVQRVVGNRVTSESMAVSIPAGVDEGQTLKLSSQKGTVFVRIAVEVSDMFVRDGINVHSTAKISLSQAVLGGTVRTPGLYGPLDVKIPAGTASHHRLRLSNRGIQRLDGPGKGDHIVEIKINVPRRITQQQRDLLTSYAQTESNRNGTVNGLDGEAAQEEEPGFFDRLRNKFSNYCDDDDDKKSSTGMT
ncbi:dnaJ homolog subfamily A member 3, mitochondrial-like [Corticium candelabrum]|uniref:dnaJ homolog subfamily A member 3, mitochondrial-like n=1 Tax=Corticium candelabrum TaxID=121492 RepID=UPI002E273599|nr:dnaJ homolog subfamily A member 3, mitochondrial-like [Corticium candelabrum]